MIGREAVILGSGDIGMIMAGGLRWKARTCRPCLRYCPSPAVCRANIEQCLNDYGIPLMLSHTITAIQDANA
jgi:hypothetical protein